TGEFMGSKGIELAPYCVECLSNSLSRRELFTSFEHHVLCKMSQALLRVRFKTGTNAHKNNGGYRLGISLWNRHQRNAIGQRFVKNCVFHEELPTISTLS